MIIAAKSLKEEPALTKSNKQASSAIDGDDDDLIEINDNVSGRKESIQIVSVEEILSGKN